MSSFLQKSVTTEQRIALFKAVERFIFIAFRLSQARGNYRNSEFYNASRDLYYSNTTIDEIINKLNERLAFTFNEDGTFKLTSYMDFISNKFKYGSKDGFYGWSGLRYFLYEYELFLLSKSHNKTKKITWERFVNQQDMISIEHILPQTPNENCWQSLFGPYTPEQLNSLTNSLGNLLALSTQKNSSLQNDCYVDKRANKTVSHGYFNGSYSENRVAELYEEWNSDSIKSRGLEMLKFLEERWNLRLGNEDAKVNLLNLDFLIKK